MSFNRTKYDNCSYKQNLKENEIEEIKNIFKKILTEGERYNVEEIESWFENEGSWSNKASRIRIINISHYIQDKYEHYRYIRNKH